MTLENKTILITGASRGIGYAASLAAAQQGATVIGLARTVSGLEALDDAIAKTPGKAVLIPADIASEEALTRLPAALEGRFGHLDGLVLNAGLLGPLTPIADVSGKEWHEVFTINLHANLALLKLLHPLLEAAEAARVVGVTSRAAQVHKPFWGAYAASKAGFEALVRTYAAEQTNTNIKANLLDPGPTATAMRAEAMPGEDPASITPAEAIGKRIAEMLEPSFSENAEVVVYPRPDGK